MYTIQSTRGTDALYTPRGGALEYIRCKDPEVIISGPAETGKTLAACWKIHTQATKYSGARIVILRKRQTDIYNTVLETYREVISGVDDIKPFGGNRPGMFVYPNGSKIYISGIDKASKVLSSERDIIYCNQVEEFSLRDWEYLTTRATGRGSVMPYTQVIGDCNPDHPTHWIKTREKQGYLKIIESRHTDNPTLYDEEGNLTEQGIRTISTLDRLTGSRKLRLKEGLWAAPEGAIYEVFTEEKHKVKSFEIPLNWARAVGIDPVGAYTAGVWGALDPLSGVFNIYREYYQPFGITTKGHAENVKLLSSGETIFRYFSGAPSEKQPRADWTDFGIFLEPTLITDVWWGVDKIYELLKDFKLVIHDSCPGLISDIATYRRKMKDGIATEEIDNKDEFHLLDALRYLIVGLVAPHERTETVYDPVQIGRSF